jgi:hypothetical protein
MDYAPPLNDLIGEEWVNKNSVIEIERQLAVDENEIGLYSSVAGENHRAITQALGGLDALGEVDFLALGVRHR